MENGVYPQKDQSSSIQYNLVLMDAVYAMSTETWKQPLPLMYRAQLIVFMNV